MNRGTTILFCACFAPASVLIFAQVHGNDPRQSSVLSMLKKGQTVRLTEVACRYEITILKGAQAGHKVLEVKRVFIAVEGVPGTTQSVIPIYAVSSIKTIKLIAKSP